MNKKFKEFIKELRACTDCKKLFDNFKPNPIVMGNKNAKIMHISQAPSKTVDKTGLPFNDASGERLKKEWYEITDKEFYNGGNFYLTSIANCYPGKTKNGNERNPPKYCANKWIERELEIVEAELIVLIGGFSASYFFPDKNLTDLVFKNQKINNVETIILPHPSPRNIKWFKDNPGFEEKRIPKVRKVIKNLLN